MMRALLMLYCFLLSSMTTHAIDWERQLWQSKLNTSSFAIAGKILQCDTLQLAKQYNQTPVSGHFVSARVTDSLFRDYVRRTHKEDSLNHLKELKELHAKVDKEAARARKLNLPPVVFEEPQLHSRVYIRYAGCKTLQHKNN